MFRHTPLKILNKVGLVFYVCSFFELQNLHAGVRIESKKRLFFFFLANKSENKSKIPKKIRIRPTRGDFLPR